MSNTTIGTANSILIHYDELFREFVSSDVSPKWLSEFRQQAHENFLGCGFPTTRHEEWRYTNLRDLATTKFLQYAEADHSGEAASDVPPALESDAIQIVFVNGRLDVEASHLCDLPDGVNITSFGSLLGLDRLPEHLKLPTSFAANTFAAMNGAFATDGAVIHLSEDIQLDRPIELVFIADTGSAPKMAHYRNSIVLEGASQAKIVERYVGRPSAATYLNNVVTDVSLAEKAHLDHYKLQEESTAGFHIATTQVELSAASDFRSHYFSFGGALVRNEINCSLNGERIECTLNGVYQAHGSQHMDQRTRIDHAMPHCNSHESYKGILNDRSHGVFNGKIYVHPDAQKTDAKQSNQVILLSDDAVIDTKPQLEIYADDVKCTHGATVGDLDFQALHYLKSRGISSSLARSLLVYAFANEVVQEVSLEGVRDYLESLLIRDQQLEEIEEVA